jgi:phosphoribosylglycinamide formyltransferase-1
MRILVCSSGGGSNFQSLVLKSEIYKSYKIHKLVVDRECGAIEVAKAMRVEVKLLNKKFSLNDQLIAEFQNFDLIVLAGFMPIIGETVILSMKGNIINTHPSLLPMHGGLGMYGVRVQESVLKSKDEFAGCTIHQVNAQIDEGLILAQSRLIVPNNIDPWTLGGLVHDLERELLPLTVHRIAKGEISLAI